MDISDLAREILAVFKKTHRRPGARMVQATLQQHVPGRLALIVAISELRELGYLSTPDAETVELTARGFDLIQSHDFAPR
jgi:hypothetical protein